MSHRIALAAALALGTFASAHADTLSFTGFQTGSVAVSVATPSSTTANAGEFKGLADGRSFMSYCIELTQQIPAWNAASGDYTRRGIAADGRFDAASIGAAVATRAIMADLRAGMDGPGGGPAPFAKADRSRFLQALDRVLVGLARG